MSHCIKQSVSNVKIELQNKKEEKLECYLKEVDIQQQRITILIANNDENSLFIKKMTDSKWLQSEGYHISFPWNGQSCQAKMTAFLHEEVNLGERDWEYTIQFQLSETISRSTCLDESRLFFFIPYTALDSLLMAEMIPLDNEGGVRDITKFKFSDRQWTLRYAYTQQANLPIPFPMDIIQDRKAKRSGLLLEVLLEKGDDIRLLEKQAGEICSLLSFAVGGYAFWETAWYVEKGKLKFYQHSLFGRITREPQRPLLVVEKKSKEMSDFYNPCSFISKAQTFYEYNGCSEWWRVTLLWYLHARLSDTVEVNKMIESMLFDRVTSKVFSIIVKEALNCQLCFGERRKTLRNLKAKVDACRANSKVLTQEDDAFLKMCEAWTSKDTYIGRIKTIAEYIGISLKSTEVEEIDRRNSIMHQGELLEKLEGVMEYDDNITKNCLLLLLPLLGYGETFTTRTTHYVVSNEAKNWERLNFLSIQEKARKLLK